MVAYQGRTFASARRNDALLRQLLLEMGKELKMSDKDKSMEEDLEKDQTTRPSLKKGDQPIKPSGTARQPTFDRNTGRGSASDDPTE